MLRKTRLEVKIPTPPCSLSPATTTVDNREPLSPLAMVFRQPQTNCYILYTLGFEKIISASEIKAGFEATIVRHPRFSSIEVTDKYERKRPRWVRTNVNLDDHIIYPDLGPAAVAGDPLAGDRFVEDYTSGIYKSRLDPSRPLWDLHFLAIRTSEAAGVAIFRIHHSIGDGMSFMSLLLACSRRTSDFDPVPLRRPAAASASFAPWVLLFRIWTFIVYAWNTFVGFLFLVATIVFLKDTKTPIMVSDGTVFLPKRFVHRTISLDDLKGIKKAMGCTINDALVGVTSAALSRYLSRSYDGCLPKNLRIRTIMFVNIRPTPGINALADMMKEGSRAKWGNQLGYVLLRFPVMKCEDPLDYVRKGTAVAERKKKSWEAIFSYASNSFMCKSLGIKVLTALLLRVISSTTLTFSNIAGPTDEINFCGSPLVYIAPTVYGHSHALTIHFQSYVNKMKVVLAVDELVIPDPHKLLDDIVDCLQLIKDAVAART